MVAPKRPPGYCSEKDLGAAFFKHNNPFVATVGILEVFEKD